MTVPPMRAPQVSPQTKKSIHAIIPAAGRSRRMGQPKLLLKIDQQTLIERLLQQLRHSDISTIHVLARSDDLELQRELTRCEVEVVIPDVPPPQMRESVDKLLAHIVETRSPKLTDGWLLIPADHPLVIPSVLESLIAAWQENPEAIIIPIFEKRRGHPTIFPWAMASRLCEIPADHGLNWLLKQPDFLIREVEVDEPSILWDVDTPEDFRQICDILKH